MLQLSPYALEYMTTLQDENSVLFCMANLFDNPSILKYTLDENVVNENVSPAVLESQILEEVEPDLDMYTLVSHGRSFLSMSLKVFVDNMEAPVFLLDNEEEFVVHALHVRNPMTGKNNHRVYVYIYGDGRYLVLDPYFGKYHETRFAQDIFYFYQGKVYSIDILGNRRKYISIKKQFTHNGKETELQA